MRRTRKTLNELYPEWASGGGVFCSLSGMPWAGSIAPAKLDLAYHGVRSGGKKVSPLVSRIAGEDESLSEGEATLVAEAIKATCLKRWVELWSTLSYQYDPLTNYKVHEESEGGEELTHGLTVTRTDNLTDSRSGSTGTTKTGTEELTHGQVDQQVYGSALTKAGTQALGAGIGESLTVSGSESESKGLYGYNSSASVPSDTASKTDSRTEAKSRSGTDTTTYNLADSHTGTDTLTRSGTDTTTYDLAVDTLDSQSTTHTGTTASAHTGKDISAREGESTQQGYKRESPQDLIKKQRDTWMWSYFRDVIFPDLDRMLCLSVY